MEIKTRYDLGESVFLRTDTEQLERIIVCIKIVTGGSILYTLCQGTNETLHYEVELSRQKNIFKSLGIDGN